jgi:hypothetical protein
MPDNSNRRRPKRHIVAGIFAAAVAVVGAVKAVKRLKAKPPANE